MSPTTAQVRLWGRTIGAVSLADGERYARFQYEPEFLASNVQVAPLTMPLSPEVFQFSELPEQTFSGLPGLLSDSLPDRYGNALIDRWLASQGRTPQSFNAVERLCYVGRRGMGALEFQPSTGREDGSGQIEIAALVELASEVLSNRQQLAGSFAGERRADALRDILSVGTSAGGARAKAVIAWNPQTNEVRSGQADVPNGFEHWLLKFDGVSGNRDKELEDPKGFGAIELAYAKMATAAGIKIQPTRLLEENGRRHFMTKRFDRTDDGRKLHMQSLGAIAHLDFNSPAANSYEQALLVIRRLELGMNAIEEQFRRMVFNVVARNQDDHVKNIAFLMGGDGNWVLSPAYDVTYAYQPDGAWTSKHQMSINGKRDDFELEDLRECARTTSVKRGRAEAILQEVTEAVTRWPEFAEAAGVSDRWTEAIAGAHRLKLP